MSIKLLLTPISSPDVCRSTLDTAAELARRSGAHIQVLHVRPDPKGLVPYTGEGMDGSMIEEIMEVTEREGGERAAKVRDVFEQWVSDAKLTIADSYRPGDEVTVSWSEQSGREDEVVAVLGRLADLVVVGRPLKDSALPSPVTLEAALMDTGRPIVVAPPDLKAPIARHIAVAWEGSTEAARAITAATPLLDKAEKVTVMTARAGAIPLMAEDLAEALSWHGIKADAHNFDPSGTEIGAALLAEAAKVGADMMVKGAYSQSRLRQMILGGRTRHIIFNTQIPVLLAH